FLDAHMLGICRSYVDGVLRGSPWFDDHLYLDTGGTWSRRWPAVAWRLRRERVDLAILFPNSFRSALVARLGRCARRVGYRRYLRGWLLTDVLEPVRDARRRIVPSPIIDAYNLLAEHVGCPSPGHRLELFTTAADERAADVVWEKCRLNDHAETISLNPGAAFGAAKHWP